MPRNEPLALDAVRGATNKASSQSAYHAVLSEIGNDHQGTLYAEAEAAVEPLLAIALSTPGWPAITALNALTEMVGSFEVSENEPGRQDPDPEMKQRMRNAVARRRGELLTLSESADADGTAECARELLAEFDDPCS